MEEGRLVLVELSNEYKDQLFDMMDEWTSIKQENNSPWAIFKNDYHDFDNYVANLNIQEEANGKVPDSTYFALDKQRNIFVGAVNIRHKLNEKLLFDGGHIGDGIRPSERHKGYGTQMVKLALNKCKALNINKVLMVCDASNEWSRRTIVKNGGVLENTVTDDKGRVMERYWIKLS